MIPSSFLSSQQFADAHLCKYYSIFFSFGLHLIYSVSEHKKSDYRLLFTHYCPARHFLTESSKSPASIANIRLTFHLQFLTDTWQYKNRNVQCEFTQFYKYTVFFRNCYKLYGWFLTFSHTWRHFASTNFVQKIFIKKFSFGSFHL